jgi:hypothetical protein
MRIYPLGLALFIVVSGVGIADAAEKGSASTKCVQACDAEHKTCVVNSGNELSRHCDMPWLVCRQKCK